LRARSAFRGTSITEADHSPRNARHSSSFPAFVVDEALGEDLGGCCGQLYARQFPAVSFEMNTDAPALSVSPRRTSNSTGFTGDSRFSTWIMLEGSSSLTLVAFDLIELQADDLRNEPLAHRKQRLAKLLARGSCAITYNEYLEHDGPAVFNHACRLGLDGIVSKRLDSPYRSGPSKTWLKSKNPLSEAVRRKREEDWS
jgi:hypothetical protein